MKRKQLFFVSFFLTIPLLLFLSACSNYAMDNIINGKFVAAKAIIFPKTIPNQDIPLNLLAQIYPLNASNKDIIWNVSTGNAVITDTRLTNLPALNNTITLRATILNGLAKGKNLVQDIVITVQQGGTETNPWLVYDNGTLKRVGSNALLWTTSEHYRQIADIDITETNWTPIGGAGGFFGVYKGNGYTISNLEINAIPVYDAGLFGIVNGSSHPGTIDGVNLINCKIMDSLGTVSLGGIAGWLANNGKITNCSVKGTINGNNNQNVGGIVGNCDSAAITNCSFSGIISVTGLGGMRIGGIAGQNQNGKITKCASSVTITGTQDLGGIVGYNSQGTVDNCHSNGIVKGITSPMQNIGGIAGTNRGNFTDHAIVMNCYSTANVGDDLNADVGGIVGRNQFASGADVLAAIVTNCYSGGTVTGATQVGGIVGYNNCTTEKSYSTGNIFGTNTDAGGIAGQNAGDGTVKNCYATGNVTGAAHVGGIVGNNNTSTPTTITNCYAIGNITGTSAGGIAGFDSSISTGPLTNCVALSKTIASSQGFYISSNDFSGQTVGENYFRYGR